MTPAEKNLDALKRKNASLKLTVDPWLAQDHSNKRFPRMSSQTAAAVTLLSALVKRIDEDLKELGIAPEPVENRILAAFQFWNVFRSKFAQRLEPELESFLKAADELAWLCYKPARDAAYPGDDPACKEPPLVYFSAEASPFVDPRNSRFHPDGIPATMILAYGWSEAATKLPFALIAVPWFQTGYLPGALAIAHEAGHAVEGDFGLALRLGDLIGTALNPSPDRKNQWRKWIGEMFADLWACLALGPAFAATLADILWPRYQADPSNILTGEYPPPPLRVCWNIAVLKQRGFDVKAAELWPSALQPPYEQAYLDDADQIAAAWLEAEFPELGNKKLWQILNFGAGQQKLAREQAESARKARAGESDDVRALWAATQIAYDQDSTERLLERIVAASSSQKRAADPRDPARIERAKKQRADHIRNLGRSIL